MGHLSGPAGNSGIVEGVIGTVNQIDVDSTNPAFPILSLAAAVLAALADAATALQPADIGVSVQAHSPVLDAYAGGDTPSAFTLGIVDSVDAAAWRAAIGAGTSSAAGANPTATLGLAAINGVAATFMRSDAAPALDQGIVPTWTGAHIFNVVPQVSAGTPAVRLVETDAPANSQRWVPRANSETFEIVATLDDNTTARVAFAAARVSGSSAIDTVTLGNTTDAPDLNLRITELQINAAPGTAGQYLRSAGAGAAPAWTSPGANPSASVGLTAVNGSATTFMRSDGAPPIDQSIAPTWTGIHTWSANQPQIQFTETDAAANAQRWRMRANGGIWLHEAMSDDGATLRTIFRVARTGVAITDIQVGNSTDNPSFSVESTGQILKTPSNTSGVPDYSFSTDPDTGARRIGANRMGLVAGGVDVFDCNSTGVTSTGFFIGATYTPTLTNGANVAGSTAHVTSYMRVGNVVYVAGQLEVDPTAAAVVTTLEISLPIASNLANADELAGGAVDAQLLAAGIGLWTITGSAANNRAVLDNRSVSGLVNRIVQFWFQYQVI